MPKQPRQQMLAGFDDDPGETAVPLASEKELSGQVVYVVDSHSLIFQVFHSLEEMASPSGQPVAAVFGFTRDVLHLIESKKPDYLFCAFDRPEPTFRHQMYDDYKAGREEMPDELRPQIPSIRRMLGAMGVPALDCESYEADDVLATMAVMVEELGGRCCLVTGDKDCRQLITPQVQVYNIRKDQFYDAEALQEDWGVRPDQVVDFQSLVGDSVDNVPGVPLIGPKLARELLEKYDTLDEVLDHADEVSGPKRRENLINFREQALLSRELVRLVKDVPLGVDWSCGRVGGIDVAEVKQLCQEFGFRRIGERLQQLAVKDAPKVWEASYRTIATEEELSQLAAQMAEQKRISVDTETTSSSPRWADLVGFSFAWQEGEAYYVPVRAPRGDPQIPLDTAIGYLKPILEDPQIEKVGQNLKYDMIVLRGAGVMLQGAAFDSMVAHYLLEPGERNHRLDELAKRYLNRETIKISSLIGTGKKQKTMDAVPLELVGPYAAEDADVALRLTNILEQRLDEEGLASLFVDLELPLIDVLAEMEFEGITVDTARLMELSVKLGRRVDELEAEIYELAGKPFNINSPQQLAEILFDKLELPTVKKTKTGRSTDVDVLEELAKSHELPAKIIEYRQNAKLKNTYVDALPDLVCPKTGRVHTSFTQDVAATGRLSSKDPNLQNIPVRSSSGREIRSAFRPGHDDWKLLTADYSQIELRVLAHFSGDAALQRAFFDDEDIHARVASQVYGVGLTDVTTDMRRSAKAINFGIIYGQSPFGLANALDIDRDEASQFIDAYFDQYPGVDRFMTKVLAESRKNGYVSTVLGRRRAITGVRDPAKRGSSRQRILPERIAINTVIQGSAADLIKQAMLQVYRRLKKEHSAARMLLQIHDELVFESPPDQLSELATLVNEEMSGAAELDVPLKVDIKTGNNWAECEPWN